MTTREAALWYCVWCWAAEANQDPTMIDAVVKDWQGQAFLMAYDALTEAGFWRACPGHGYQALERAMILLEAKP